VGADVSGPAAPPQASRPRVLVVEDDADVLHMIATLLKPTYDVVLATDGMQALETLRRGPLPDLVVTDVMMPRMDGLELANAMKHEPRMARIPVLMLTAKTDPRAVISGINAGARHYLTKPFKPDDLLGKIRKTLGR